MTRLTRTRYFAGEPFTLAQLVGSVVVAVLLLAVLWAGLVMAVGVWGS